MTIASRMQNVGRTLRHQAQYGLYYLNVKFLDSNFRHTPKELWDEKVLMLVIIEDILVTAACIATFGGNPCVFLIFLLPSLTALLGLCLSYLGQKLESNKEALHVGQANDEGLRACI